MVKRMKTILFCENRKWQGMIHLSRKRTSGSFKSRSRSVKTVRVKHHMQFLSLNVKQQIDELLALLHALLIIFL